MSFNSSKTGILFARAGQTNSSKSFHAGSRFSASKTELGDPAKYYFPSGLQYTPEVKSPVKGISGICLGHLTLKTVCF